MSGIGIRDSHFSAGILREFRGNGNGQCVIQERIREWELLLGNRKEWELTIVAEFPHNTRVSVMSHDAKCV